MGSVFRTFVPVCSSVSAQLSCSGAKHTHTRPFSNHNLCSSTSTSSTKCPLDTRFLYANQHHSNKRLLFSRSLCSRDLPAAEGVATVYRGPRTSFSAPHHSALYCERQQFTSGVSYCCSIAEEMRGPGARELSGILLKKLRKSTENRTSESPGTGRTNSITRHLGHRHIHSYDTHQQPAPAPAPAIHRHLRCHEYKGLVFAGFLCGV